MGVIRDLRKRYITDLYIIDMAKGSYRMNKVSWFFYNPHRLVSYKKLDKIFTDPQYKM